MDRLAAGHHAGITIVIPGTGDEVMGTKATQRGVYTLNGGRFHIQPGDELPEGAVLDTAPTDETPAEERAKKAAPENKAAKAAPENRSA